jgi:hypothetical protein
LPGAGWITALRGPAIKQLADAGAVQLSLFDQTDLAEISHPDYTGERLVACRNPALAAERARKRHELLAATDAELDRIVASVAAGRLRDPAKIGVRVGRVVNKFKMAKHYHWAIADGHFSYQRRQDRIDAEAALDGVYLVRTSVAADQLTAGEVVEAYKRLRLVEASFRSLKTVDLELRPIHHRREQRVRAHVLICMLAAYLVWHLRRAWAPLTYTDEHPPTRDNPVAAAQRSQHATAKAHNHADVEDKPVRSFRDLIDHLGTLTRNTTVFAEHHLDVLATPTATQHRAFELIGAPVPVTLR